jgi:hypothetical protein
LVLGFGEKTNGKRYDEYCLVLNTLVVVLNLKGFPLTSLFITLFPFYHALRGFCTSVVHWSLWNAPFPSCTGPFRSRPRSRSTLSVSSWSTVGSFPRSVGHIRLRSLSRTSNTILTYNVSPFSCVKLRPFPIWSNSGFCIKLCKVMLTFSQDKRRPFKVQTVFHAMDARYEVDDSSLRSGDPA